MMRAYAYSIGDLILDSSKSLTNEFSRIVQAFKLGSSKKMSLVETLYHPGSWTMLISDSDDLNFWIPQSELPIPKFFSSEPDRNTLNWRNP